MRYQSDRSDSPAAPEPPPLAEGEESPQATKVWTPGLRRLGAGLVLTVTLVAFQTLAVATVMPVVADDLGGLTLYGWVFSGFFLGSLLGIVFGGQNADRRGVPAPYGAGVLAFTAGLVIAATASSMAMLVAGRVVQGMGTGAILSVAYTSIGRFFPGDARPRVFAILSTAWVVPGLMGPAAANVLTDLISWRAVFWALVPFVGLAAAISLPALLSASSTLSEAPAHPSVEPGGEALGSAPRRSGSKGRVRAASRREGHALALVAGSTLVLGGLASSSPIRAVGLCLLGAPLASWAFLRLVPPGTIRFAPGLPAAIAVRGVLTFAFFGTDAYVSLALTDGRDQSTWVAGVALTAATLSWTCGAWFQQRVVHERGPRWLVRRGFGLVSVGIAGMLAVLLALPPALAWPVWGLAGLGMGMSYSALSVTVLSSATPGQEGAASSSLQLSDVLGISLGTGLAGAFVAAGEAYAWTVVTSLALAFTATLLAAAAGGKAATRLPTAV